MARVQVHRWVIVLVVLALLALVLFTLGP
jgi:hypothetical protein